MRSTDDDAILYYWFHRPKNIDIEPYRDGLPLGEAVAIFGYQSTVIFSEGDPGQVVYEFAPQGLFVDTGDEIENVYAPGEEGWPELDTFEELEDAAGD